MSQRKIGPIVIIRTLLITALLTSFFITTVYAENNGKVIAATRDLFKQTTVTIENGDYYAIMVKIEPFNTYVLEFNSSKHVDFILLDHANFEIYNQSVVEKTSLSYEIVENYNYTNVTEQQTSFQIEYTPETINDALFYFTLDNSEYVPGGVSGVDDCEVTLYLYLSIEGASGFSFPFTLLIFGLFTVIYKYIVKRR